MDNLFCLRLCYNNNNVVEHPEQPDSLLDIKQVKLTWENTIPFIPPVTGGIVIKVYDGDTITIATQLPLINDTTFYRFSVRLNGIDCPEINSRNNDEKSIATIGKQLLQNMLLNNYVTLTNVSLEKYGRILADVHFNNININELMLERKLAVKYNGKTKKCPDSWSDYYSTDISLRDAPSIIK